MMISLENSYLEALKPTVSIKIEYLDKDEVPENILAIINIALSKTQYRTFLDIRSGVIYVGKKV